MLWKLSWCCEPLWLTISCCILQMWKANSKNLHTYCMQFMSENSFCNLASFETLSLSCSLIVLPWWFSNRSKNRQLSSDTVKELYNKSNLVFSAFQPTATCCYVVTQVGVPLNFYSMSNAHKAKDLKASVVSTMPNKKRPLQKDD